MLCIRMLENVLRYGIDSLISRSLIKLIPERRTVKAIDSEICRIRNERTSRIALDELVEIGFRCIIILELIVAQSPVVPHCVITIDPEAFTSDFLLNMLKEKEGSTSDETVNATYAKPLSVKYVSSEHSETPSEEDTKEELKDLLAEKLMGTLGGAADIIVQVIQYLSYVLFFTFFTWLYLIIKILAKLKKVNNAIKLKLPIWLGSLPFVVLCLFPMIGIKVAANMVPMLGSLTIRFMSAGLVSFIIGIGFMFFTTFYYGKLRKALKEAAKAGYTLEEETVEVEEDAFSTFNTEEEADANDNEEDDNE